MGSGFRRSKFRKYTINILAGVSFTGAFIICGPYFKVKLRNIDLNLNSNHEYVIKRERNQLEDLVNKYDKSKTNDMLNTFDQIVDFNNTTKQVTKKFRLYDYESEIRKKVSFISDIEPYSDFWLILSNLNVTRLFNNRAFENFQTIFLNQKDNPFYPTILRHEYMHSIGGIKSIFSDNKTLALNEGLTQYFSNIIFDDGSDEAIWNYYNEQKLVKVLEEISAYIEKREGIKYNILAKCFFMDNSINEFIQRFDKVFGYGKFNSIFYEGNIDNKINNFNSLLNNVKNKN